VLVTAASTHRATDEIAKMILHEHGWRRSSGPPEDVDDIAGNDAVVIGSADVGHWLEPARKLADRTATLLRPASPAVLELLSSKPGDPSRTLAQK
jgi:hypothetical protein